jgi:putative hydrolase of the HAD superfamily
MNSLKVPSLIIFDLDDTLYDYEESNEIAIKALIQEIAAYTCLNENAVAKALYSSRAIVKQRLGLTASSHSRLLYISETFRQLGLRPDTDEFVKLEEVYWDTFLSKISLFPGVEKLLNSLMELHIPLALVTDLTSQIQYRKVSRLKLNGFFDYILTSEESGGDKPSGRSFEILQRDFIGPLRPVWFFGDSNFDFPAATSHDFSFFKKTRNQELSSTKNGFEFGEYFSLQHLLQNVLI